MKKSVFILGAISLLSFTSYGDDECQKFSKGTGFYTLHTYRIEDGEVSRGRLVFDPQNEDRSKAAIINYYSWECSEKELGKRITAVPMNCRLTLLEKEGNGDWRCECSQDTSGFKCKKMKAAKCSGYRLNGSGKFEHGTQGVEFVPAKELPSNCTGWLNPETTQKATEKSVKKNRSG